MRSNSLIVVNQMTNTDRIRTSDKMTSFDQTMYGRRVSGSINASEASQNPSSTPFFSPNSFARHPYTGRTVHKRRREVSASRLAPMTRVIVMVTRASTISQLPFSSMPNISSYTLNISSRTGYDVACLDLQSFRVLDMKVSSLYCSSLRAEPTARRTKCSQQLRPRLSVHSKFASVEGRCLPPRTFLIRLDQHYDSPCCVRTTQMASRKFQDAIV